MLDLTRQRELDWLARLVADLRTAVPTIEPLIVGALARDLLLHYGHGFEIERATKDVDFAIAVTDWEQYATTRQSMLESGLFAPDRDALHKLRHAKSHWVDLIPFGALERGNGTIAWPPAGDQVMTIIGYAEAAAAAVTVALPGDVSVRVVSLPMLAALKVMAWSDRHRDTHGKDAVDLRIILRRYLEAGNLDRLYAEFPHVIGEDFDFETTGAWLLGRDLRAELRQHSARFDRVVDALDAVLAPELDPSGNLTLALQLTPRDPENALQLLGAFHGGLSGAVAP
ncbi:MAG: nucleotidyl transferase AbiEii/AbiGii toxin family protein [Burkholderiales bacterium]